MPKTRAQPTYVIIETAVRKIEPSMLVDIVFKKINMYIFQYNYLINTDNETKSGNRPKYTGKQF